MTFFLNHNLWFFKNFLKPNYLVFLKEGEGEVEIENGAGALEKEFLSDVESGLTKVISEKSDGEEKLRGVLESLQAKYGEKWYCYLEEAWERLREIFGIKTSEPKEGLLSLLVQKDGISPEILRRLFSEAVKAVIDETRRKEAEKLLPLDPLTGLYRKKYFLKKLEETIVQAEREGRERGKRGEGDRRKEKISRETFGLIIVDIDFFKVFNDSFGYEFGDRVLQFLARTLEEVKRENDLATRYGGEEFVLLVYTENLGETRKIAERLQEKIRKSGLSDEKDEKRKEHQIKVSLGVIQYAPGDTKESLQERLFQTLHQTKHAGRDRITDEKELEVKKNVDQESGAMEALYLRGGVSNFVLVRLEVQETFRGKLKRLLGSKKKEDLPEKAKEILSGSLRICQGHDELLPGLENENSLILSLRNCPEEIFSTVILERLNRAGAKEGIRFVFQVSSGIIHSSKKVDDQRKR